MKVEDWARMFYDIDCVKKRVLEGTTPLRWRNLQPDRKGELVQALAGLLKKIHEERPSLEFPYGFYNNDPHLLHNWREITDLNKYGIFLNKG